METGTVISALVLSAVLPVSVATLYALVARHTQLASESAMDSSVLASFDNVDEVRAYNADLLASCEVYTTRVLARYWQAMLKGLKRMDPDRSAVYRLRVAERMAERAFGNESVSTIARAGIAQGPDAEISQPTSSTRHNGFDFWDVDSGIESNRDPH